MVAEFAAEIFERELNKLIEEINLYPNNDKIWEVTPGIKNSGGNLCLHICGNLQHFIGNVLGNTGYVRNRDREFTLINIPSSELISEIQKTIKAVVLTFESNAEINLEEEYTAFPAHLLGKEKLTKGFFLMHLISHMDYHIGQINYHRRMISQY
jgi:uncharacterized damage-inducible protein DinB